jgi:hypothetical protein
LTKSGVVRGIACTVVTCAVVVDIVVGGGTRGAVVAVIVDPVTILTAIALIATTPLTVPATALATALRAVAST